MPFEKSVRFSSLLLVVSSLLLLGMGPGGWGETKRADFAADPEWEGKNNRVPVVFPPIVQQSFGYSPTHYAGKEAGEIGGYIQSTATPAHYAKVIDPVDLESPLSFSGSFSLVEGRSIMSWKTSVGVWIGFFNQAGQGFRPPNFIGWRLMGFNEPDGCTLEVSIGTRRGEAAGLFLSQGGKAGEGNIRDWDTTRMVRIAPDSKPHPWTFDYDPKGNEGFGEITFRLDGVEWKMGIREEHRAAGLSCDRFGIFNDQIPGRALVAYFDDLKINGHAESFSEDPQWEAKGNSGYFEDTVLYGSNDFGYTPTRHTGGEPGEIGGRFWRVGGTSEPQYAGSYGDDIGTLTLEDRIEVRGKIAIPHFSIDSGMHIGFFDSSGQGWEPKNFIGVNIDSHSVGGRFMMPMYGTRLRGEHQTPFLSPWFKPGEEVHDFSIVYDPEAAGGKGAVTATLDDQSGTLELPPGARADGASMNRFGMFNMQDNNGKHSHVYLDDLEYTVER